MSDALDRIRQRTKPKVPPRDSSLTSPAPQHLDTQTSKHTDVFTSELNKSTASLDTQTLRHTDASSSEINESQASLDIQTSRHINVSSSGFHEDSPVHPPVLTSRHTDIQTSGFLDDPFPTKRSTFRLESDLIERLHTFCRRHGLSREVLIEAMYEYMEDHSEAMEQVVTQAQAKNEHRQQIANRKRAESMINRFGGGQDR